MFKLALALGEHMSKKHPNQSVKFIVKQQRREDARLIYKFSNTSQGYLYGEKAILFRIKLNLINVLLKENMNNEDIVESHIIDYDC